MPEANSSVGVLSDGPVVPDGPSTPGNPARLGRRLQAVLAVVVIADVLDLMDSTITNIAAPTIVREIGAASP